MSLRLAVLVSVAVACGYPDWCDPPALPSPKAMRYVQSKWADVTADSIAVGRRRFIDKCGSCHDHPNVALVAEQRWNAIVERMAPKASLDTEDTKRVLRFILAAKRDIEETTTP